MAKLASMEILNIKAMTIAWWWKSGTRL